MQNLDKLGTKIQLSSHLNKLESISHDRFSFSGFIIQSINVTSKILFKTEKVNKFSEVL